MGSRWLKMYSSFSNPLLGFVAMAAYSSEHSWLRDFVPKLNERLRGKLVAHRGFHDPLLSDLRPLECTLPAVQMAWDAGVLNCECDVRLSADEQIILLHDPNLDRLVEESARPTPNANTIMPEELLVGGLEHFLFFHILGTIIPID